MFQRVGIERAVFIKVLFGFIQQAAIARFGIFIPDAPSWSVRNSSIGYPFKISLLPAMTRPLLSNVFALAFYINKVDSVSHRNAGFLAFREEGAVWSAAGSASARSSATARYGLTWHSFCRQRGEPFSCGIPAARATFAVHALCWRGTLVCPYA